MKCGLVGARALSRLLVIVATVIWSAAPAAASRQVPVSVTVAPATGDVPLARTGAEPWSMVAVGLVLVVLGTLAVLVARRAREGGLAG